MRSRGFILGSVGVVVVSLGLAAGCGAIKKASAAGKAAISTFHQQYNAGEYQKITDAAHPELLSITPADQFQTLLKSVHDKLGDVKSTATNGVNVKSMNGVTTAVLTNSTTFENGTGTETFTFRLAGGKAVLLGYHINSADLITQ